MKQKLFTKIIPIAISLLFFLILAFPFTSAESQDVSVTTRTYTFYFSQPQSIENNNFTRIYLQETTSYLTTPGRPMLPTVSKTFEFPRNSLVTVDEVRVGEVFLKNILKSVEPVPMFSHCGKTVSKTEGMIDETLYSSSDPYPSSWYEISRGSGLNKTNDQVRYLTLRFQPVQYIPEQNVLQYIEQLSVSITVTEEEQTPAPCHTPYDLVIITPSEFSNYLHPLITHKNSYDMKTTLVTVEDIYASYPGRDHAEQIKYFIKYAIETWNSRYALLVGDITRIPIRSTDAYPWKNQAVTFGDNILSDLYYADIYDENYTFCCWDANNNNIFGEVEFGPGFPPKITDLDNVDLYPDIHVGRLPCTTVDEVRLLVDKIIVYERYTYNQIWFKQIILAGGDTFPPGVGGPRNVFEGEITNIKVAQQLPDFNHIYLWSSKRNLNAFTFNQAITQGAGFLTYAGHGFEHGWGTYRPNYPFNNMGLTQPLYYSPLIRLLRNQNKLPIMFFDACLTAKLDFNISDLSRYYPTAVSFLQRFTPLRYYSPTDYFPCFAWSFLAEPKGGAIAAIGATRPAYTWVDKDGVYAGAGYLDVRFFSAYYEGVTLGQMFTQAQNDYINNVGKDFFTLETFLLLGDPSLMVGGYP